MLKGFDYWISEKAVSFVKKYWISYFIIYLCAVSLSVYKRNVIIFFIIGVVPYLFALVFRNVHDPTYSLKKSIDKIDPKIFQQIFEQKSKLNIHMKNVVTEKQQSQLLYGGLQLSHRMDGMDQRIIVYRNNVKKINWICTNSLAIWFFTFLILAFVLFIKR